MRRKFQMDAKLAAETGEFSLIGDHGGDLFQIPGEFSHPIHGVFNVAFIGNPPKLVIMHARSRRVGIVDVTPMFEVLGKEIVKVING